MNALDDYMVFIDTHTATW